MKVAQRFIAGNRVIQTNQSPGGTDERCPPAQSSLRDLLSPLYQIPAINRWAIFDGPFGAAHSRLITNRNIRRMCRAPLNYTWGLSKPPHTVWH